LELFEALFQFLMTRDSLDDLIYFCTVYHREQRDKEALEALNELIDLDPAFDNTRRILFQAIYKLVIDSIRETLNVVQPFYDSEVQNNRVDHASFLHRQKDELCRKLIVVARDGITAISQQLLPNATEPQMVVFFQKMKGDLYRYIAEFSDESESIAAGNAGEESYNAAFDVADAHLALCDPVRLTLILNAAVFRYEIRKDADSASEMLERTLADIEGEPIDLKEEEAREVYATLEIMRGNLRLWAGERSDGEGEGED
jgi:14-3-3 protein epsilon